MKHLVFLIGLCFVVGVHSSYGETETARGIVFHDQNENGVHDENEPGIENVWVSNGVDLTATDANGAYEIEVEDHSFVFVCKPRGWITATNELNMPHFYHLHSPDGSPPVLNFPGIAPTGELPDSIDFPLYPYDEQDEFRIVVLGDPQVRNVKEVDYLASDIVQDLVGVDAAFGVSLGDLAFDDLRVFGPLNQVMSRVGIPWYNVHGNHDMNFQAADDFHSADTYKRVYGPTDYLFTYGDVHFIVLDNVEKRSGTSYHGELGAERIEFLQNIIDQVEADEMVVVLFHIPMSRLRDMDSFIDTLEQHPRMLVLSSHFHRQYHEFYDESQGWDAEPPLHHLVHVTACGNWWGGEPDERGIPHSTMACGTPNGWSFISFDGSDYTITYRAARRPADYQMDIYAPHAIPASETAGMPVRVNVFAGSSRSTVQMRIQEETDWQTLEPAEGLHVWAGELSTPLDPGVYTLEVSTTDMFDQTYVDHHVIRVHE